MSAYTEALSELVALPRSLDERLRRSKREVDKAREQHEAEIEAYVDEQEAVLNRLEEILERARSEGVDLEAGSGSDRERSGDGAGTDPLEYARQLVARLDEALSNLLYTRDALHAERESLSEDERRRAAAERRRREEEGLRGEEQWDRARQGTNGLIAALLAAAAAGALAGAVGSAALLVVPLLVAALCFGQAIAVVSTLPALAVRRATGSMPSLPAAPPREARLAAAAHAAAGLALCALTMAAIGFAADAASPLPAVVTLFAIGGAVTLVLIWALLPRTK